MSKQDLNNKVAELIEMESFLEEVKADIESRKDEIKQVMNDQETEELILDEHIVRWVTVKSNRFDTTSFKKQFNDIYKNYTKVVTSRRFQIC